MRNVFLQLVYTISNTYSSHGDTTATCRPKESDSTILICPHTGSVQNVLLPPEATEHIPLTPTASAAVDTQSTVNFNHRVMNDNDESWAAEADHRTGWNTTFKSGTFRGALYGIVLRDYPKQVVSLTEAKSVPTICVSFSLGHTRHCRIDETVSTVERKAGGPASAGTCPSGCKEFSHRLECAFRQVNVQDLRYHSQRRTSSAAARSSFVFPSTHGPQEEQRTHAKTFLCRLRNLH